MGARLPEEERSMINGMVRQRGEELLDSTSCNVPKLGQLLALSATSLAKSVVFQYATVLHNPWILGLPIYPHINSLDSPRRSPGSPDCTKGWSKGTFSTQKPWILCQILWGNPDFFPENHFNNFKER